MKYILEEIKTPNDQYFSKIVSLWSRSFGDDTEYIESFYKNMPVYSTVCILCGHNVVSMAVLLKGDGYYYGYAVCTDSEHRNKGLCKSIHGYIKEKCEREEVEYFIHPADASLEGFYTRLGMTVVASQYEVKTLSYDIEKVSECSASDYMRIRELYFGGFNYYPWSEKALSFMKENGIFFLVSYIDGVECAAAVEGERILELCAPDYLLGRSASAFLKGSAKLGAVRFMSEPNHMDAPSVMSFSGKSAYFNLFLE